LESQTKADSKEKNVLVQLMTKKYLDQDIAHDNEVVVKLVRFAYQSVRTYKKFSVRDSIIGL